MEGSKIPELETQETLPGSNHPRDETREFSSRKRRLSWGRRPALSGSGRAEGQGSARQEQEVPCGAMARGESWRLG